MNTFLHLIKGDCKQQGLITLTFSTNYNSVLSNSRTWKVFNLVFLSSGVFKGVLDKSLCDKVCEWLVAGRWFSPNTPVSYTNKTDRHDITEILLRVTLNTIIFTHNRKEYVFFPRTKRKWNSLPENIVIVDRMFQGSIEADILNTKDAFN